MTSRTSARRLTPLVVVCLVLASWCGRRHVPAVQAGPPPGRTDKPVQVAVYDPDPGHLWNRLHAALLVRLMSERGGEEVPVEPGNEASHADELDPLLWPRGRYLLDGPGHDPAVAVLDEFLATDGDKLVRDPLKRALLQRDLWALFDRLADPGWPLDPEAERQAAARRALAGRLARAIRRLALTADEIRALPDNYAAAAASVMLPAEFDRAAPEKPFLPPELWQPRGPWVLLGDREGEPLAPAHLKFLGGRSVFSVFLRLPGGRDATCEYLGELRGARGRDRREDVPQLPEGTQVALARRMVLIDDRGALTPTHLTETVQLRVFRNPLAPLASDRHAQQFFEVKLHRRDLLAGKAGGLRGLGPNEGERDFLLFLGHNAREGSSPVLGSCRSCHNDSGIHSVLSFTRRPFAGGSRPDLTAAAPGDEGQRTLRWKQEQFSWGLLQGLADPLRR
jgi:hypothetical protein